MPLVRITNGFNELPFPELLVRSNYIVGCMTGNPGFLNPNPALGTVQTAIIEFGDAMQAANSGDLQAKGVPFL